MRKEGATSLAGSLKVVLSVTVVVFLAASGTATAAGRSYEVTTGDGVTLRGWVHLPAGEGPFPTILEFTPYIDNNGSNASNNLGGFGYLLEAGYALARVSVRGTGRSGGCLHFGDRADVEDVTTVIEDLARRSWSTGRLGMVGHSYPAWTQDMAVSTAPEPLKAVVPTSGVIDLWSLLTRRGAPLAGGTGILFAEAWTAQTSVVNEGAPEHLRCPNLPVDWANNAETATTGDRTAWFTERDLRDRMTGTRVPMLRSQGLQPVGEGHIMQVEGLWDRLRSDRTHFILGQWWHQTPVAKRPEWPRTVVAWFDHYLRDAPQTVETGVVEYQDDAENWHTARRWPPPSTEQVLRLSGTEVVGAGEPIRPTDQTFNSADWDPGTNVEAGNPRYAVAACGSHQALYVSKPAAQDALIAGNFDVDVTLSSTLPGGNFAIFIWKTPASGSCPDRQAAVMGRAMMDLRHWLVEGRSRDFPVGARTSFTLRSQPFASLLRKGERLVVAVGGGAVEMTPDPLKPVLTIHNASFRIPVVEPAAGLVLDTHDASSAGLVPDTGRCGPSASPRTSYRRGRAAFSRRRRLSFRGAARALGCGGGIKRVELAMAKRSRKGPERGAQGPRRVSCRFVNRRGHLGRPSSCGRRRYLPAIGTTSWRYAVRRRLPRGHYKVWARSVTPNGVVEAVSRRNTRTFKIRR